MQQMVRHF